MLLCVFCVLTVGADSPENKPLSTQTKWPALYPYPIGAGIQGLASNSTDIIVADVLETHPRKALEGASDNLKLKVVRVMMGRPVPGDTLDLLYSLYWIDDKMGTLEPPKIEEGKRYVLFLNSHVLIDANQRQSIEYELSDQWLSVMPERPRQAAEIATAIRVAHGDARGTWSESVAAFQARLVAYRGGSKNQAPIISFFLDLHSVTGGDNTSELDFSKSNFTWEVTDETGKAVAPNATPGDQPKTLLDQKAVLESGQTARLPLSPVGAEIPKDHSGYLSPMPGKAWSFDRNDKTTYYLSGKVETPFTAQGVWYGTLQLPKMAIPTD
jgi:hypothetical protein